MSRQELQQLGLIEAASSYKQAWNNVNVETGIRQPLRSLEVARRFIQQEALNSSGILIDLSRLHEVVGIVPSALAIITDPQTAANLLRHEDFKSLSSDHPTYQAFKPYVGNYIVFRYEKDDWLTDRKAAALPYSEQELDDEQNERITYDALTSVMGLVKEGKLPENWIKFVTSYQVVRHATDREVDPEILSAAVDAHSTYTHRTITSIIMGAAPRSIGKIVTYPTLKPYHKLKQEITTGEPKGRLKDVLAKLPDERRDAADVAAALIGGLSTLRSFTEILLFVLAKNPDLQTQVLHDPDLLTSIMQETARMYPAAPYILRKTTQEIHLGETTIPKDALIVFGIFAYGVNPDVPNANTFDPHREGLHEMYTTQGGAANVFSYGPRACLGKHIGSKIVERTAKSILEQYEIRCSNNPILMIGRGIGSTFDRPVEFQLVDRKTGQQISAISR